MLFTWHFDFVSFVRYVFLLCFTVFFCQVKKLMFYDVFLSGHFVSSMCVCFTTQLTTWQKYDDKTRETQADSFTWQQYWPFGFVSFVRLTFSSSFIDLFWSGEIVRLFCQVLQCIVKNAWKLTWQNDLTKKNIVKHMHFDLTKWPDKNNTVKHNKNVHLTKLTKTNGQVKKQHPDIHHARRGLVV